MVVAVHDLSFEFQLVEALDDGLRDPFGRAVLAGDCHEHLHVTHLDQRRSA
jgi:hypothetical protein